MDPLHNLDIPAAIVGVLVIVRWFLDDRKSDRVLWSNHLAKSVEAQTQVAAILSQVAQELRILSDKVR